MPPIAAASAPSSLLPLRIARQGIRGGQGWGERSLYGSQSRRATRGAIISARASMMTMRYLLVCSSFSVQNITCCANQTQTAQRKSYSGPTSPPSGSVKEKVKPRLDDGGVGFPPFRFGGGGGGGGGGGSSSSGGFILFVIVLLLDYLREFERNLQNGSRRGSDYDNGLAPQ
nr:protein YELLOW LEAF 1, choloroplastic-like isoform X1 [Setaria viridis]